MGTKMTQTFESFVFNWWWVLLFILLCYLFYEQGLKTRNEEYTTLHRNYMDLKSIKKNALIKRERLLLQINSQSDPAWVELILMKRLGLAPEGQTKVFFKN